MQNSNIKNIIFDLGVVLINIDTDLSVKAMKELGFSNFQESYTLLKQTNLFDKLEKGLINPVDFRNELREYIIDKVSDEKINQAWNAMLLDFPVERIDLIKKLSEKYNIYLLSNTNEIHYNQYIQDFKNQFGFDFNSLFVKPYYSFKMGMRKPDLEIFQSALSDSKLKPEETLFIDDLKSNIESAKKTGLQTLWFDVKKSEEILEKLYKL